MLKMIICDDDKYILEEIERQIQEIFYKHRIVASTMLFTEPDKTFTYCLKNKVDFILLDIDMPVMNGFELSVKVQKLPKDHIPIVMFMSSQDHFVYEAFQYRPFDFLRKGCIREELENKIDRMIREYAYNCEQIELVRGEDAFIQLRDVMYFKSNRNRIDAYTLDGCYRCKDKISVMEDKYINCLIRCSKQYLVNVNHISKIMIENILLKDGRRVPLSRRKRKQVEEKYERLMRK